MAHFLKYDDTRFLLSYDANKINIDKIKGNVFFLEIVIWLIKILYRPCCGQFV